MEVVNRQDYALIGRQQVKSYDWPEAPLMIPERYNGIILTPCLIS